MNFDITLAFDKAEYLNPQAYMFFNTLAENVTYPGGPLVHITTNRDKDDELIQYIQALPISTMVYWRDHDDDLKSRCKYMFHCFEIQTARPWVIKMELDMLVLKHLDAFNELIEHEGGIHGCDIILEPENRKIFDDNTAHRLWRIIYKAMGMKYPKDTFIQFRENREKGLPLFGTGIICVKSELLPTINKRWIPLTKICEKWIDYGIHPNEFAYTGMVFDEGWKWWTYDAKYKFNPIGHFRKGEFPSTELIDNPVLPDDTVIFDYHRSQWLYDVAKANPKVMEIVSRNKKYLKGFWDIDIGEFVEKI